MEKIKTKCQDSVGAQSTDKMITCVTYSALIWDTEGAAAFFVGVSVSAVAISSSYNVDWQKNNVINPSFNWLQ